MVTLEDLSGALAQLGLNPASVTDLLGRFHRQKLVRQQVWLERGTRCQRIAFVAEGALGLFYDRDGDELCTYIATQGLLLTALKSFLQGVPTAEQIVALADTTVYDITQADYFAWIAAQPSGWHDHARLLEYQIGCVDDSRREAITLTAAERYRRLLEQEPKVIQSAPLQVIASVLGVTPQHLSRIRKGLAKGQS